MTAIRSYLDKALEWFLVILMVMLLADVLLQVASRYLLANTISFTDELAGFLLIWVGMAGAAYVTGQDKGHLAITYVKEKFSAGSQKRIDVFIHLTILCFALTVLIAGGVWLVYTRFYLGQISPSLEISLGYVYVIIPVSGLIIVFYSIDNLLKTVSGRDGS